MNLLRRIRGLIGTAVVWAFGWAFMAVAVHTII